MLSDPGHLRTPSGGYSIQNMTSLNKRSRMAMPLGPPSSNEAVLDPSSPATVGQSSASVPQPGKYVSFPNNLDPHDTAGILAAIAEIDVIRAKLTRQLKKLEEIKTWDGAADVKIEKLA